MSVLDLQGMQIDVQNPVIRAGGDNGGHNGGHNGGGPSNLSLLLCTGLGAV